jgi:hypothetical protein
VCAFFTFPFSHLESVCPLRAADGCLLLLAAQIVKCEIRERFSTFESRFSVSHSRFALVAGLFYTLFTPILIALIRQIIVKLKVI